MKIGRQRHQPRVVDRTANGKVVQALKVIPAQAEHVMKGVVEVTSDPSAADTGGHRLCLLAEVSLNQCEQWQVLRATFWTFPEEVGTEGGPEAFVDRRTSLEEV